MHPESFLLPKTQVTNPAAHQILLEVLGMEPESPAQLQAAQGSGLGGAEQEDSAGWSPGRGEGAAQAVGCQRMGTCAARTGMFGRCSTVLVHPREHLRPWFHWSSGLLHPSLPFSRPWAFHVGWSHTKPGSPKPSTHSKARAVEEIMLMQHPNKRENWSILASRGR